MSKWIVAGLIAALMLAEVYLAAEAALASATA
jgi:hypothetical protein